ILVAQKKASDESVRLQKSLDEMIKLRNDGIKKDIAMFVRPFEIIEKVDPEAYRLDFLDELNGVHDMFHVSNLKKCLADPTLKVPLDKIQVYAKLNFVIEPVEILKREIKKLKRSRIAIVKIEQYFLMINYSLWEVILNGDSLIPTRVVEGVLQPVAPTTAEQRLQKLVSQLEIHGVSLFQEDVNLKFF
nr:reverse transcriptase domain-containing protein [Tanacetum cinerariifolium]